MEKIRATTCVVRATKYMLLLAGSGNHLKKLMFRPAMPHISIHKTISVFQIKPMIDWFPSPF